MVDEVNKISHKVFGEQKDLIGRVYEYFLKSFAVNASKEEGEFYTPHDIVELIAAFIEPYDGTLYDPCCGSGGMFVQCAKYVEEKDGDIAQINVYGQENDPATYRLAKMNLAVRGISHHLGERNASSFTNDLHKGLTFDYIMANPPFNLKRWYDTVLCTDPRWADYGVPPESNANYAWILHILSKLKVGRGVAGFLLANGALGDSDASEIRRKLIEGDKVEAIIDLLQQEGWDYTHGGNIRRNNRDILIYRDLRQYLQERYPALEANDLDEIVSHLQHTGGQTHFDVLRNTYRLLRDGYRYTRHSDGEIFDIEYVDFDTPSDNRFRCVNQYEVGYGMQGDRRIPDVLLFVNGIPLCIFELKNPTDATATIADAYQQIYTRYMRDIPHLLRYCPLSCISDATDNNTKLGTTYTPYEHYYAWKKVNNEDKVAEKGLDQVRTIVSGVYAPVRFWEIVRDYIYFPDEVYPKQEEVVCRYPQFLRLVCFERV